MITSLNLKERCKSLKEIESDSIFRLAYYEDLNGTDDEAVNIAIKNIKSKLKQITINLDESTVKVRDEKIFCYKGNIKQVEESTSQTFAQQIFSIVDNQECEDIYPAYSGTGEIMMELSFSDFAFIELEDDEIVIKEDSFWICEGDIDIDYEGDDELLLVGTGVVVMELPVSEKEIFRCRLNKDTFTIFNQDVIFKRGRLEKEKNRSSISYSGIGELWVAATKNIYEDIKQNKNFTISE